MAIFTLESITDGLVNRPIIPLEWVVEGGSDIWNHEIPLRSCYTINFELSFQVWKNIRVKFAFPIHLNQPGSRSLMSSFVGQYLKGFCLFGV